MEVSPRQVLGPLGNGVSLDSIGRSGRSQRKRKPGESQEKEDGVVRVVSPHPPLIPHLSTGERRQRWLYQQFHIGKHIRNRLRSMCFLGVPSKRYGPWICNPGSITQGPVGEGAGQAAVEGGSLGGAAVVQSAGVGFVVCSARYVQWKCSLPGRNSCIGIGFAACTESEHEVAKARG